MNNTTTAAALETSEVPALVACTPLYGHTSRETAYVIADYPYGRQLRCQRLCWIESHPKKGFRFVAQTQDPRNNRWNAPKTNTYALIAACMYLDENNHVHHAEITEYSTAKEILGFCVRFPGCDATRLKIWISKKIQFNESFANGTISMRVNGQNKVTSDHDKAEHAKDAETLKQAYALLPLPARARGLAAPRVKKPALGQPGGLRPLRGGLLFPLDGSICKP